MHNLSDKFWTLLDNLVDEHKIVIDRPKGSAHPKYPDFIYPIDYGYLAGTCACADNAEIDIWVGSLSEPSIDSIICIIDPIKLDSEIKILYGCTSSEKQIILNCLNEKMGAILVHRS